MFRENRDVTNWFLQKLIVEEVTKALKEMLLTIVSPKVEADTKVIHNRLPIVPIIEGQWENMDDGRGEKVVRDTTPENKYMCT